MGGSGAEAGRVPGPLPGQRRLPPPHLRGYGACGTGEGKGRGGEGEEGGESESQEGHGAGL
jgi:hypothetical protein